MVEEKLREYFSEMVVYKDLKKINFFKSLSLPSFMRDWLLQEFQDEEGEYSYEDISTFIQEYLPKKNEWNYVKNRIINENEKVKILAKISINIDIKTQEVSFCLPDYDLPYKHTIIEPYIWDQYKDDLLSGKEKWGVITLGYRFPDVEIKQEGKIKLLSFKDFCPYEIDLEYYKDARKEFSTEEWIDILLGAIDYNADGYSGEDAFKHKMTMLTRLLPFVEKRLNIIELAPKGTGKSYLFGQVSRYGWLSTGGVMSRAKMFYDISKSSPGLINHYDFVALDEIQTINFTDVDEIRGALKGYLESGTYTVGNYSGDADAGVVLLGNIRKDKWSKYENMFEDLPVVFQETALLDRFHGFISGWNIPRMHDDLKVNGWALNSEYFCSIMHLLRDDGTYRNIVDDMIKVPEGADTRDTEAVKRIATAYLKLLFPNVRATDEIKLGDFRNYCLVPANHMRDIIKYQMGLMDTEFRGKQVPKYFVDRRNHDK